MATDNKIPYYVSYFSFSEPKNTKVIFYSFWNAEQNTIVAQSKYYVYAFLISRKNLQNCMNFPSYKETASLFCVVFSNLLSKNVDDTSKVLEQKIEILALLIVILLSVTQLIILQAACFLFCALMSFDFSIWWSWSFSKILKTVVLAI